MDRLRYQPPHPLATEIFRAYDIRGIVDEQLSDAMLYHIGLAVGTPVSYTHLTLPTNREV